MYDPRVIRIAAYIAILLSFSPKFASLIEFMPSGIVGGISFMLYGMIAAIGVRNVVEAHVDFSKSRNVIVAAIIVVCALGLKFSPGMGAVLVPQNAPVAVVNDDKVDASDSTVVRYNDKLSKETAVIKDGKIDKADKVAGVSNPYSNQTLDGSVKFTISGVNFSLSGLAIAALAGIILNLLFPDKDPVIVHGGVEKFDEEVEKEEE